MLMKLIPLMFILLFFSTSFAESYRLLDTPRCIIDLDVQKNIVDVSKCSVFHDQYYGDSTFYGSIACHDKESLNAMKTINVIPRSLSVNKQGAKESYIEITARTNYSFKVDFVYKMAGKDPIVFSEKTFFDWLKKGRVDRCQVQLESPQNIKKIN